MVLVKSRDAELGMDAPNFELDATDGHTYGLDSFDDDQVLVVMFICNHCPYVKAVRQRLIDLADDFDDAPVGFVAINANDGQRYPADNFEHMAEVAREYNYPFAYLYDDTQEVARAYGAVCTPDIFVFDDDRHLQYRGRIDDNWKDASQVDRRDLRRAIEAMLAGDQPAGKQHPSRGCSIKWKE